MHSRVVVLFFVGLISLELTACAGRGDTQPADRKLLDQVLLSEQAERPQLWTQLQMATTQDPLVLALLQSLPGHPGHAPGTARQRMLALLGSDRLESSERRLVQLRLLDLRYEMFLENALKERDKRLKSLIEIERDLQGAGEQ